mgnify:CR=1 FL=1
MYPEQHELKELFHYDAITGSLTWAVRRSAIKVGDEAGCFRLENNAWSVTINGNRYVKARLIWIYVFGSIPDNRELVHKNNNKHDFRLRNLDCVTPGNNELRNASRIKRAKWEWSETCKGRKPRRKRRGKTD